MRPPRQDTPGPFLRVLLPGHASPDTSVLWPAAEKTGRCFCALRGISMLPSLRDGDILAVERGLPPRLGDVVIFASPHDGRLHVHRIVGSTGGGLITRGDAGFAADPWVLSPDSVLGHAAFRYRGSSSRPIRGGRLGLAAALLARLRLKLAVWLYRRAHGLYSAAAKSGLLPRLLPRGCRPRRIVFEPAGLVPPILVWGKMPIGRYNPLRREWDIRRPFRLLVEPRLLQWPPGSG